MYAELEQKVCSKCKVPKEKKEFGLAGKEGKLHSHCKLCKKTARAKKRKDDPEHASKKDFQSDLMKNYGMSVHKYEQMLYNQQSRCACCNRHESEFKRGLHVDHDHSTGQVRALLCTRCNPGLGYFEDSVEKLEMAITYLKKFKK